MTDLQTSEHELLPKEPGTRGLGRKCSCGQWASVVDEEAAEVWHLLHARWPDRKPAELAEMVARSMRQPDLGSHRGAPEATP